MCEPVHLKKRSLVQGRLANDVVVQACLVHRVVVPDLLDAAL